MSTFLTWLLIVLVVLFVIALVIIFTGALRSRLGGHEKINANGTAPIPGPEGRNPTTRRDSSV